VRPEIRTARLRLRPPALDDLEAVYAYASDPAVVRYMGWPRHTSRGMTRAFLRSRAVEFAERGTGTFLVELDGAVIGSTGLHLYDDAPAATGYIVVRSHWGHGYATEATLAMIALARENGLPRVEAGCHPDNAASIRVLEKCGLRRDATLPAHMVFPNLSGAMTDLLLYSIEFAPKVGG
jgi:ribosomal-protein-alanine N-acetyltransferase